ncbi:prolipoprotein diacylglyceryl transferase [Streptomyces fungicidicus]|uniref:hypothetical protein n=1 Tax=Streptomyces fungicidicus TaxID=68203 RepID=UPI0036C6948E
MAATVVLAAGTAVLPYGPVAPPLGAKAAYGAPGAGPSSRSPSPSASPSASTSPTGEPSHTGNRPDEERDRPGRHEGRPPGAEERERDDGSAEPHRPGRAEPGGTTGRPDTGARHDRPRPDDDGPRAPGKEDTAPSRTPASQAAVPEPSATSPSAAPNTAASTEPVLRILPLGSGLVLIGLGFGLAFVALRMRQAAG